MTSSSQIQSPTNMAGLEIEPLPLSRCGLYSLVTDDGEQQLFCNALTGDMASIDRSAEMVELGIWFDIEYSVGGWAYLMDTINDEKYWVADMAWSKTVVRRVKPHRLFMQDRIAKKAHWYDNGEFLNCKTVRTLVLSDTAKFTFTTFPLERGIMDSRDVLPHRLGGKCFWDMRCLLPCLDMEALDEATRRTWTKDNFWRARSYWEKLFTRAGGGSVGSHWFRSQDSFIRNAKQAIHVKTYVLRHEPMSSGGGIWAALS